MAGYSVIFPDDPSRSVGYEWNEQRWKESGPDEHGGSISVPLTERGYQVLVAHYGLSKSKPPGIEELAKLSPMDLENLAHRANSGRARRATA